MKALGFANGTPCPIAGQYLKSFDFEAHDGIGDGVFTADPRRAMRFATLVDLLEFWKTMPKCKPIRLDGRPNRPLTATTITFEEVP